jgi:hypothetical protein
MGSDYLCNLVIPGAAKSGTSSLHTYLGQHPMISMSSIKEPHHFCIESRYAEGAKAHNKLFDERTNARYFGESSTAYLPWPIVAERISNDLDHPKVIMVLRHPVARSFSHYRWRYRLGLEKRSFLKAMQVDGFGFHPERPTSFGYMAYLEFSQYSKHCPFWENVIGSQNCMFISSEELQKDRESVVARCFEFLDLPKILWADALSDTLNKTAALSRRPSRTTTMVAKIVPNGFKSSQIYKQARNKLLRYMTPQPPASMTQEEQVFAEEKLGDDIAWYEARFGNANNY